MHELKTGLNADKCTTFWMFPKSFFTHSFCKCPHTLYNRLNTSRLARFRKNRNMLIKVKRNAAGSFCNFKG